MKREELKTGMIVVYRSGKEATVVLGTASGDKLYNYTSKYTYDIRAYTKEDLSDKINKGYDILEVYAPKSNFCPTTKGTKLWAREADVKEMTITDVEKVLGHKVKIVGER